MADLDRDPRLEIIFGFWTDRGLNSVTGIEVRVKDCMNFGFGT